MSLLRMLKAAFIALSLLTLSGCSYFSNLVYKIDIPQGNYIDERQVEKLRVGMNKDQVLFVLGTPMANNAFDPNTWSYVYRFKSGRDGSVIAKHLVAKFDETEHLIEVTGDYQLHENFHIPVEEDIPDFQQDAEVAAAAVTPEVSEQPVKHNGPEVWAIKVGEFGNPQNVKRLQFQLEQAGYEVNLRPLEAEPGEVVSVFAEVAHSKEALEEKLELIAELTKTKPIITKLPPA
ncbi:outer membrane protein assembly factor BamE [Neiella sp. HB171785]|uniref:Outer membrane protein assembly factor BamE n=1 Tax=Neiella litorisoli TaxID=2771431 RepID=A0A8J6ULM6_9GAMM|nr:outer membrane protein assembly factor BamE [Neiella litorisoli]MBD1389250.1 outer membrane protein assembly factor BamE [Neiella litorisoli]